MKTGHTKRSGEEVMKLVNYSLLPILVVSFSLLAACSTFDGAAVTTLNVTKTSLDVTSSAYLAAVESLLEADLLDSTDIPSIERIASLFDLSSDLWALAAEAYLADRQKAFLDVAACLLNRLVEIRTELVAIKLLPEIGLLDKALIIGQALISSYGGSCEVL